MKVIALVLLAGFLSLAATCSVQEDIEKLQSLKLECQELKPQLDDLGSKQWTDTITQKVQVCKDHGFWPKKKRRPPKEFLNVE